MSHLREDALTPEIETYQDQLLSIRQDAPGLAAGLSDEQVNWRPAPNRWSIGECFDHLSKTAAGFMPHIDAAIEAARARSLTSRGPFVYPVFERFIARISEPPPRWRTRAGRAVQPSSGKSVNEVLGTFLQWQDRIGERLRQADGLDLRRARVKSPIPLITWSLGTTFAVMLAHERRHLWQARQVRKEMR